MRSIIKKGYTLLEMMIVVVIIGILIGIGIYRLSTLDAEKYYSESCVNTLYGPLSERVYYAATSRILSGENAPESYSIKKIGQNSGFSLEYRNEHGQSIINKTGLLSSIPYCQKGRRYRVHADFNFSEIRMLPTLIPQGNQNGFEIFTASNQYLTVGIIAFSFCSPFDAPKCREFGEILFDARTAMVKKRFCKLYFPKDANNPDQEYQCRERSTGQ